MYTILAQFSDGSFDRIAGNIPTWKLAFDFLMDTREDYPENTFFTIGTTRQIEDAEAQITNFS